MIKKVTNIKDAGVKYMFKRKASSNPFLISLTTYDFKESFFMMTNAGVINGIIDISTTKIFHRFLVSKMSNPPASSIMAKTTSIIQRKLFISRGIMMSMNCLFDD